MCENMEVGGQTINSVIVDGQHYQYRLQYDYLYFSISMRWVILAAPRSIRNDPGASLDQHPNDSLVVTFSERLQTSEPYIYRNQLLVLQSFVSTMSAR